MFNFCTRNITPLSICNALSPCYQWSGIMEIIRGDTYMSWHFRHRLEAGMLNVRIDAALTIFSLISPPHFSMTMFPRSVHVHAPLVHHRHRILYTFHYGWVFNTLHFTCSIFQWQHHTTFNLQCSSHLVTHGVELWRLLEEIHTCHGTFATD